MTDYKDDIAALRDALAAGPIPTVAWEFGSYGNGEIRIGAAGDSKHGAFATMVGQWAVPWDSTEESREAFNLASYITVCNPERIARLLDALESAKKDASRLDWLDENPDAIRRSTGYRGSASSWSVRDADGVAHDFISARAAIDAAMKEST